LTEPRKDVKIYYTKLLDRLKNTPVEKMNEPASLEEEMKDEQERRALHLKRLQNMVDNMNETLGLNDTDKEDVLEYLYNKEKVTIH
jgi:Txe/YoeB family toxin of Txe-Axe toxin-antitoxin module